MSLTERFLIWDFDGTIAEREGMWGGALVEAAARQGIAADREVLRPFLRDGFPWHQPELVRDPHQDATLWWKNLEPIFLRAFVEGLQVSFERASIMALSVRECYLSPDRWRLFEDVTPCLEQLSSAGWRHLILSNHVPELETIVAALELSDCFEAVFSSGVTGVEKPNPIAFRIVQEHAGQTGEIYMIGDSWSADICGAGTVGIEGILVRKQHEQAARYCHTLAELPQLLASIESA